MSTDARYNLGASPDATTCGESWNSWDLMFRWPNEPGTSFATLRIDGDDWVYGRSGYIGQSPVTSGYANDSWYLMGDIAVSQHLELVPNDTTAERDVLRVTYTMTNWGSVGHDVGLRSMIDTELDYNDGAIFRADGVGIIDHEREFRGAQVPTRLQTLYSASDTVHVGTVTLRTPGSTPPDRVVIAQWPLISQTAFDYWPDESLWITGDSALGTYWYPDWLAAGATRTFTLSYGRGTTGSATVPVSPSEGSWHGGNEVTIAVPGLAAGTTPYVTFGDKRAQNVTWGTGWARVKAPALGTNPESSARAVRVRVQASTSSGLELLSRDDGYTYRGVAVVFLRGISTEYKSGEPQRDDSFDKLSDKGIYKYLIEQGIPTQAIHQFSYQPGSDSYNCHQTYGHPVSDASSLVSQIAQILVDHKNVDLYLVGHSKGGAVAMTYLARLTRTGKDPTALAATLPDGTGVGRLAGVITLDSPVGGIQNGALNLSRYADMLCPGSVSTEFMSVMNRLIQSSLMQDPLGAHASILGTEFPGAPWTSNQALAEAQSATGDPNGPGILTVGNTKDEIWTILLGYDSPLLGTTQWIQTAGAPSRVWARTISDSDLLGQFIPNKLLRAWLTHGRVTTNDDVKTAIIRLIHGNAPTTASGFTDPSATNAAAPDPDGGAVTSHSLLEATTPAIGGIAGVISHGAGEPVSGAYISALSASGGAVWTGVTAADGSYSIATGPGTYILAVNGPAGGHPFGFVGSGGFTTRLADAMRTTVTTNTATIDVALPDGTAISGQITVDGGVRGGVSVEALDAQGDVVGSAETAIDGGYTLVVPAATYAIRALGDGSASATAFFASGGPAPDASSATAIEAAGSPIAGIDVDLPAMASLTGSVTDDYGDPLVGVFVTAAALDGSGTFSTTTRNDGAYQLPVDPGIYQVSFRDPSATHADGLFGPAGWVADEAAAEAVEIGFADVPGISVALPFPGLPGSATEVTAAQAPAGRAWVDWEAPTDTGGAAIDRYEVVSSPGNLSCTAYAFPGCMVDGLQPGVAYSFQVWAANAAGYGDGSAWSAPLVIAGPPGVPEAPVAVAGDASATISWDPPAETGGSPITSYTVTSYPEGKTCATSASTTQCKITGLSWYEAYTFTVTATNLYGEGQPSNASYGIWPLDLTKPTMGRPTTTIMAWARLSGSRIPVEVTVPPRDTVTGSGICTVEVERSTDGGRSWSMRESVPGATYGAFVASKGTIRFRARAIDCANNRSAWVAGPTLSPRLIQDTASGLQWKGKWVKASSSSYSGKTGRYSTTPGASVKLTFTGRSIALVGTTGVNRGKAKIYVGTTLVAAVDLGSALTQYRTVVWQKTWSNAATRTVRVVVVGTSGRPRVDVDAFAVLR